MRMVIQLPRSQVSRENRLYVLNRTAANLLQDASTCIGTNLTTRTATSLVLAVLPTSGVVISWVRKLRNVSLAMLDLTLFLENAMRNVIDKRTLRPVGRALVTWPHENDFGETVMAEW